MNVEEFVNREGNRSTISKKLYSMLLKEHVDRDNVCGIFADLETDEERQLMIDYIERGIDVDEEQIILNSIWIAQQNGH